MTGTAKGCIKDMRMKFLVLAFLLCTTLFASSACRNDGVSIGEDSQAGAEIAEDEYRLHLKISK